MKHLKRPINTKACSVCKKIKPFASFYKDKNNTTTGRRSNCIDCCNKQERIQRKSLEGCLRRLSIWSRERVRKDKRYKNVKVLFTTEELINKYKNDFNYMKLYKEWKASGYQNALSPTLDRIDNTGHYSLDNIQILTLRDNSSKRNHEAVGDMTRYIGVLPSRPAGKFTAHVKFKGKKIHVGTFPTAKEAALAVNSKCEELKIPIKNKFVNEDKTEKESTKTKRAVG